MHAFQEKGDSVIQKYRYTISKCPLSVKRFFNPFWLLQDGLLEPKKGALG